MAETLLTDTPATQWIKVKNALPIPNQDVLIQRSGALSPQTGWITDTGIFYAYGVEDNLEPSISKSARVYDVIAWLPFKPFSYADYFAG